MDASAPTAKINGRDPARRFLRGNSTKSNSLAPVIDEVEYLRGHLSSISYLDSKTARDLHILRLRKAFTHARIEKKLRFSLKVLDLMREIQYLENGYWRVTPLRVVPFDDLAILISSLPTYELQRHFKGVKREGYARVISSSEILNLPRQNINDWLELDIQNSVVWCENFIKFASTNMQLMLSSNSIQYYSVRSEHSFSTTITVPQWVEDPRFSLIYREDTVLCRERITANYYRYFVGKLQKNKLIAEMPIHENINRNRIVFGFSALVSKPITIVFFTKNGQSFFHIPMNLPRPEWQLLLATGMRSGRAFQVNTEAFVPVIIEKLQQLGCQVRTIRG